MSKSLQSLASIFMLAGGLCLGIGGVSAWRSGNTTNGAAYTLAGVMGVASGAIGLKRN
jgi:hypothetical protein